MESFAYEAQKIIDEMLEDSENDEEIKDILQVCKHDVEKMKNQANEKKGKLANEIEKQLMHLSTDNLPINVGKLTGNLGNVYTEREKCTKYK